MKTISIAIPCYNEADNVRLMYESLKRLMHERLSDYNYEIVFVDNKSKDATREILRDICKRDGRVKAIFNRYNCGPNTNAFWSLMQTSGECAVLLYCDFQEPIDMIPQMVAEWEKGNQVICMIKEKSDENHFVYLCREVYYRIFKSMSSTEQIRQFTGFGLYDRSFIEVLKTVRDPTPFLKGMVAEFAPEHMEIPYRQNRRKAGRSSLNFMGYYDSAMLSFTSYTRSGLRIATFGGLAVSFLSFAIAIVYLVMKVAHWNSFPAGNVPILIGVFFFGGCQLLFTGLLGEYVMCINTRVMDRPLAIVEERINCDEDPVFYQNR